MRRWKKFKLMMRRPKKYEPFEELNEVTIHGQENDHTRLLGLDGSSR